MRFTTCRAIAVRYGSIGVQEHDVVGCGSNRVVRDRLRATCIVAAVAGGTRRRLSAVLHRSTLLEYLKALNKNK